MPDTSATELWIAAGAAAATAASTVAAFFAWRTTAAAKKVAEQANTIAETANSIAVSAAHTASAIAQVEHDRWHRELTPALRYELEKPNRLVDQVRLHIHLDGPVGLDGVDGLTVSVRDDGDHTPQVPGVNAPTAQELADTIWGPLRFKPHVDEADPVGRSVPRRPLPVGSYLVFALEASRAPRWIEQPDWERQYRNGRLRLIVTCEKTGYRPWHIPWESAIPID
ncbi:hypothetical protein [Catellatospora methionotrophica]|uniref:hypothetical protein n=1 Tax=Catellatospora methionotrophica TaxID=121620 RepID=UPI0014084BB4|nr:hypothetical protein [Catellatospora methionotrophica]